GEGRPEGHLRLGDAELRLQRPDPLIHGGLGRGGRRGRRRLCNRRRGDRGRGSRGRGELNRRRRLREANARDKEGRQRSAAYQGRGERIYSPRIDWLMPMAVTAAEATTPSGLMPA